MKAFTRCVRKTGQLLFVCGIFPLICGCGYTLRGKVVQGTTSGVEMVHEIDPRVKSPGMDNVEVLVHRDPNTMDRHLAGQDRTDASGNFSMHVGEFGAGWMEEVWLVQASKYGFQNAEMVTKLPPKGGKWMLLITLAPGSSTPLRQPDDFMKDFDKYK